MKYNAFRFIVKPVSKDKLYEAMDSALEISNSERKLIVKDEMYNESIVVYKKTLYMRRQTMYILT